MVGGSVTRRGGRGGWVGAVCYEAPLFAPRNDLLSVELLPPPSVCLNIIIALVCGRTRTANHFQFIFASNMNSSHRKKFKMVINGQVLTASTKFRTRTKTAAKTMTMTVTTITIFMTLTNTMTTMYWQLSVIVP